MKNLQKNAPAILGMMFCLGISVMALRDIGTVLECTNKPFSATAAFCIVGFVWGLFAIGAWAGMEFERETHHNAWIQGEHDSEAYQDWMEQMAINEDNETTYKQWLESGYNNRKRANY